jgi:phage virion morphogenesis protein
MGAVLMGGCSFKMDMTVAQRAVGSAISKAQRTRRLAANIGEALKSSTLERFEHGGGPDGTPWQPSQRAQREGGQTLVDNANLRDNIGWEASDSQVVVGTNVEYGRIHQLGGKVGRNHAVTLPPRPYLGLSDEDVKECREMVRQHMAASLTGGRS